MNVARVLCRVPWELEEDAAAGKIPGVKPERPNLFSNF